MFVLATSIGDGDEREGRSGGGVMADNAEGKHVFISGLQVGCRAFADLLELAISICN